jgi:hypothetical protein
MGWRNLTHGLEALVAAIRTAVITSIPTSITAVMTRLGAPIAASLSADIQVIDTVVDTIAADVDDKAVGRTQYAVYTNASLASNAGATTVLTCTTAGVRLDSVAIEAVAAAHANLTSLSLAVVRGAVTVRTLITTVEGAAASFAGAGNQVRSQDCVYLTVGDLLVLTAAGTGAGACSVKVHASCVATANGGYLA